MIHLFRDHPASVGENYGEHLGMATGFGLRLIGAGLCCLVHGLLPFLFTTTGSDAIRDLHGRMIMNRRRSRHSPGWHDAGAGI